MALSPYDQAPWEKREQVNGAAGNGLGWWLLAVGIVVGLMLLFPQEHEPVPLVPSAEQQAAIDRAEADYWRGINCTPYDC